MERPWKSTFELNQERFGGQIGTMGFLLGPWVDGEIQRLLSREVTRLEICIKVTLVTVFEKRWWSMAEMGTGREKQSRNPILRLSYSLGGGKESLKGSIKNETEGKNESPRDRVWRLIGCGGKKAKITLRLSMSVWETHGAMIQDKGPMRGKQDKGENGEWGGWWVTLITFSWMCQHDMGFQEEMINQ